MVEYPPLESMPQIVKARESKHLAYPGFVQEKVGKTPQVMAFVFPFKGCSCGPLFFHFYANLTDISLRGSSWLAHKTVANPASFSWQIPRRPTNLLVKSQYHLVISHSHGESTKMEVSSWENHRHKCWPVSYLSHNQRVHLLLSCFSPHHSSSCEICSPTLW